MSKLFSNCSRHINAACNHFTGAVAKYLRPLNDFDYHTKCKTVASQKRSSDTASALSQHPSIRRYLDLPRTSPPILDFKATLIAPLFLFVNSSEGIQSQCLLPCQDRKSACQIHNFQQLCVHPQQAHFESKSPIATTFRLPILTWEPNGHRLTMHFSQTKGSFTNPIGCLICSASIRNTMESGNGGR